MSQHFTDFSEYTTSAQPSDWTKFWEDTSFTVRDDAGYTGGKYLEVTELTGYQRTALSWDGKNTDADQEMLVKFTVPASGVMLLSIRASGTLASARGGYLLLLRKDTGVINLRSAVSGTESANLTNDSFSFTTGNKYWCRFRANGSTISYKVWADGDAEPASWTNSITNTAVTSAGRAQVGTTGNSGSNFLFDLVGIGLGGDTAPSEAPSSGGPWYNSSWQYRVKLTIDASKIPSDLTDFIGYIDLSELPAGFHSHVKSDGGDIRITKADGITELPREVVYYDSVNDVGEVHFKHTGTTSSSIGDEIYVYYGNSGTSDYAPSSTYGAENVWTDYLAVYHFHNSLLDSTANNNDLTDVSSSNTSSGKIGDARSISSGGVRTTATLDCSSSQKISISSWLNQNNLTGDQVHYELGPSFNSFTDCFLTYTSGSTYYVGQKGNVGYNIAQATKPSAGSFHHLVEVRDMSASTANEVLPYANGSLMSYTKPYTSENTGYFGNRTLYIGSRNASSLYLGGIYDEFRIRLDTLSSAWIQAEYNNQNSPSTFFTVGSEETYSPPSGGSQVKAYVGGAFVAKPLKVWNGTAWVDATLKRYNGSSWETI